MGSSNQSTVSSGAIGSGGASIGQMAPPKNLKAMTNREQLEKMEKMERKLQEFEQQSNAVQVHKTCINLFLG